MNIRFLQAQQIIKQCILLNYFHPSYFLNQLGRLSASCFGEAPLLMWAKMLDVVVSAIHDYKMFRIPPQYCHDQELNSIKPLILFILYFF